ncbi:DUF2169 domain-containing protein [Xanthomonas cerealis pv. cerealis]|uniref:DUF2169 domain-containing protein n=1 Tax=Xanthomonas cerealis pv. cerealis TaxID=152263 RepID=A0A514E927_9XANT|nr:DUF2169 domain-containing protein [Xanthomonas translucens]QDI02510.1 DUF2169 domain-containing protein [Xanthomonas translucens pv. cerealis]
MEFRNLTPFDALCFSSLAPDDKEHTVVAMKIAYRLEPDSQNPGYLHPLVQDEAPVPLCLADEYYGETGESSVREESDLAPYKPFCDVLVRGHAHAPHGRPSAQWESRLRISRPLPAVPVPEIAPPYGLAPNMAPSPAQLQRWQQEVARAKRELAARSTYEILLDKTLRVSGPRRFRRGLLRRWQLTNPEPVAGVALRWENAWGGRSRVANPAHLEDPRQPPDLLDEVCYSNPLGRGWFEERQFTLAGKDGVNGPEGWFAPQFEYPHAPIDKPCLIRHPDEPIDAFKMTQIAEGYGETPAGFGAVGRAWAPRVHLAGTYDAAWLDHRWPKLPEDFDFGYWNAAPVDQQIPFLAPDARFELTNLVDPYLTREGLAWFDLPCHRPFLLMRLRNGTVAPMPMMTDTVIIDTDTLTLTLTHRMSLPAGTPLRVLEARFETNPAAALVRRATSAPSLVK